MQRNTIPSQPESTKSTNLCYAWADNARAMQSIGESTYVESLCSFLGSCICTIPCGILASLCEVALCCDCCCEGRAQDFKREAEEGSLNACNDAAQCGSNTGVIVERLGMRTLGCATGLVCAVPTAIGRDHGNDCICCGFVSKEDLEATPSVHKQFPKKFSIFSIEGLKNACNKCGKVCCSCCVDMKAAFCDERKSAPSNQSMR